MVRSDKALVYSEPRDVKITARYISNMTIVAILQKSSVAGFVKVQCYDIKQGVLYADATIVTLDTLTSDPTDVNAAILYTVAAATKNQK